MRIRVLSALLLVGCLSLTACGGDKEDSPAAKPGTGKPAASKKVDCGDTDLSEDDWVEHCSEAQGPNGDGAVGGMPLALGKLVSTAGSPDPFEGPGGGVLEITPTSVVYVTEGTGEKPAAGLFAVVAYKARATKAGAASESAPMEGGGWQWVAPDGQAVDTLSGNVASVTPDGYGSGGSVQPGTFQQRAVVFDVTAAQRGGTLLYVDGDGASYQWKMPAKDTGPDVAKLKKSLAS